MPLIICQKQSFVDVFLKTFLKNFINFTEKHLYWSLFIVKLVKFLRTPFSYNRTLPVAASDLSFVQIPKDLIFQGPYSSVSTVFVTSRFPYFI